MIQRRPGGDQGFHHVNMPKMGRRNQRGAVIGAGHLACLRTGFEDQLQHLHIIRDGRNSDHIVSVVL